MKDNLVFLNEKELDKSVYRIFSYHRLEEMFRDKKLALVKPKLWDDPFENFILNSTGVLPDGRVFQIGFRDHYFGQCWSLTKESDAMWRIYSPKKDGVKVKTTIRKLFKAIFRSGQVFQKENGTEYSLNSFVGKVKYSSTKVLLEMLKDRERMSNKIFDQTGWGQASSFFFKRWAFRHEKEVRLIFNNQENTQENIYQFDINPNELVDDIVFDPRMEESQYNQHKREVRNWGFDKKIIQSGLYKMKKFTLELNDI